MLSRVPHVYRAYGWFERIRPRVYRVLEAECQMYIKGIGGGMLHVC